MTPLSPFLGSFTLSPQQQGPVLVRGRDVAVTAGAGTGKTRTLVARFLALVIDGVSLRDVVAVTFTRKAAREMRNRVREELSRLLESGTGDPEVDRRLQDALGNLDAARIGTIHNLCVEILRTHPAEAAIDPRFRVLEEAEAALLQADAVMAALGWAAEEGMTVPLFAALGEGGLRAALAFLLRSGIRPEEIGDRPVALREQWAAQLRRQRQAALDRLLADPAWQADLADLRSRRPLTGDDQLASQVLSLQQGLQETAGQPPEARLPLLARLDDVNLRGGRQAAWPGGKEEVRAVKDLLKQLRQRWRAAAPDLTRALNDADDLLLTLLPPLRQAAAVAWSRYEQQKQALAGLDFEDLEAAAQALLTRSAGARSYWQGQIGALLVDEFQDTNQRQRQLVRLLCDRPGKLFVVGDAKQSIYRFRGADVTVFRAEQARIAAEGGLIGALSTSYRTHAGLVTAVNLLLAPVLGPAGDGVPPWEAPFEPLDPARRQPADDLPPPFIRFQLGLGSKKDGGLRRAADGLAHSLQELTRAGRLGYGDVAILCRASSSFAAYEDALDRAGIPYMTVAGRGFYDRPEVRDLLNALQAIADPTDDLALAGLLRSPACGLSDAALLDLVTAREPDQHLWDVLRDRGRALPGADGDRAAAAIVLIGDLQRMAGRTGVAQVLRALLDRTGYGAALVTAGLGRALRNVDKLLNSALNSELISVPDFLEYAANVRATVGREGEARAVAEGTVQIMTVHAAKGLEFPVVVIGDAGKQGRFTRPLIHQDREAGVLLNVATETADIPAILSAALDQETREEEAEAKRLLYVAATRAEELLIVNGNAGLRQGHLTFSGWLDALAAPAGLRDLDTTGLDPDGSSSWEDMTVVDGSAIGVTLYEGAWAATGGTVATGWSAPADSSTPPNPALVLPLRTPDGVIEEDQRPVWQVLPDEEDAMLPGDLIGTLVHEALAAWRFPDEGFDAWILARARRQGVVDQHRLQQVRRRVRRLLLRLRQSSVFHLVEGALRRFHEIPYVLQGEERKIDLLLEDVTGRWIIIDFKSDARRRQRLPAAAHAQQVRRYGDALTRLIGQRPALKVCYLDEDGEVRLYAVDDDTAGATRG